MDFIDSEGKKRKGIIVRCKNCCNFMLCRDTQPRKYCSIDCQHAKGRKRVTCAYCGVSFLKKKSSLKNSRSGLFFCCRKHKDLAQSLTSGILQIDHYKNGSSMYRRDALTKYGDICQNCGFDDIRCIDVHHIDGNRENNSVDNLIVLCANCHALITRGHATVTKERTLKEIIVPKGS